MSKSLPPLFFSSIPKCGKNIMYSFFGALGYERFEFPDNSYTDFSNLLPWYDLPRHDHYVTPRNRMHGINYQEAARVFSRAVFNIPEGFIAHRHMHPDRVLLTALRGSGIRPILICRDPRDCLVSAMHYARKGFPGHVARVLAGLSEEEALLALLTGQHALVPFTRWYDAYRPWQDVPGVVILRFEDIIGARGGGNDARQHACLAELISHMGISVTDTKLNKAVGAAFNPRAGTFRQGRIGAWKTSCSASVLNELARSAGKSLLQHWGYDW